MPKWERFFHHNNGAGVLRGQVGGQKLSLILGRENNRFLVTLAGHMDRISLGFVRQWYDVVDCCKVCHQLIASVGIAGAVAALRRFRLCNLESILRKFLEFYVVRAWKIAMTFFIFQFIPKFESAPLAWHKHSDRFADLVWICILILMLFLSPEFFSRLRNFLMGICPYCSLFLCRNVGCILLICVSRWRLLALRITLPFLGPSRICIWRRKDSPTRQERIDTCFDYGSGFFHQLESTGLECVVFSGVVCYLLCRIPMV